MLTQPSPTAIKAILFDLDGTLRHNLPSSNQAFLDFAAQLGAPDTPRRRRHTLRWVHYYWAQSPELIQDMEAYGGLTERFWIYYTFRTLVRHGCSPAQADQLAPQVHQRMADEYQPQDYVPPDVCETLHTLRQAEYRLGVVSNRSSAYDEQMTALGLDTFFSFALAAGQVNSWKPDPGIFLHAVDLLEALPAETIYVGDNYYADVVGAERAGLKPVLLDPDRLFPDAGCPVIRQVSDLLELLKN
jgi:HAD superfamily hydrolase (TIGR01549 family)